MKLNTKKLVELRNRIAMNQEALAGQAKVSVRTVQRAEAGEPIDLQTVQELATALGVRPDVLYVEAMDTDTAFTDGKVGVSLHPATTPRALLDEVSRCFRCSLDHDVDIDASEIDAAIRFCAMIEPVLQTLPQKSDAVSKNPAQIMIARLRAESGLHNCFDELKAVSVGVYVGTYIDFVPKFSDGEVVWISQPGNSGSTALDSVNVGIVRLGPFGRTLLTARAEVKEAVFIG